MENSIINIPVEQIFENPDNPRKDLGDLKELTESIKKNGIMQNLTVIKTEVGYMLLIGHRRCAAAKLAGVKELPCKVVEGLGHKEQVTIMLEENMQRNDLTILEQAQGFQMMLDLGATEEEIAEKSGFSRTTVRRRLEIAKLDQKILKEREKSETFQLTLSDLYALEELEDVKERDKILRGATSSRELVWKARQRANEIKLDKSEKEWIDVLEAIGVTKVPKSYEKTRYSGKWTIVKRLDLDKKPPKKLSKKEYEGCFYNRSFRNMEIIREKVESEKPETEYEKEQKEKERKKRELKAMIKEMEAQRADFVRSILSGKTEAVKKTDGIMEKLWLSIVESSGCVGRYSLAKFIANTKKNWYELEDEEKNKSLADLDNTSTLHQMLIGACVATEGLDHIDYYLHYKESTGKAVMVFTAALNEYGFTYSADEYIKIADGSHELYEREK